MLTTTGRDPLSILDAQNATRLPELVPLRNERMSASPFAFYRGTAALMAADLARDPHSGISVASCGDAHVANFGFYASPQKTLVFDLNDFDESAWAPWEWDVKRLIASVVIAGQATSRDPGVVEATALNAVRVYAAAMRERSSHTAEERYFAHSDIATAEKTMDADSLAVLHKTIHDARKRTGQRAAKKLLAPDDSGRLRFVENPPTMTHVSPDFYARVESFFESYVETAAVDVRMVLRQYEVADVCRRVVGVGSVGTRCYLLALQDGNGNAMILQAKEAGQSVLIEHGGAIQPPAVDAHITVYGDGGRVVALQRILQASSDPFLGHLRDPIGNFYVRQFHDMKGGIDADTLEDGPFHRYAHGCAAALARAHSQSPTVAEVSGYLGSGRDAGRAILEWSYAYAELSRQDYAAFVEARGGGTAPATA